MEIPITEYTFEDGMDYLRRYPAYTVCRAKLQRNIRYLFLEGDLKKLAAAELLLCRLTPWNVDEIQKEMVRYTFDSKNISFDERRDHHALGDFGKEWIDVLDEKIEKEGDGDALEIRMYDEFHRAKKWGKLLYGVEKNRVNEAQQNQINKLCKKSKEAQGIQSRNGVIFVALEEGENSSSSGYTGAGAIELQDLHSLKILMDNKKTIQDKRRAFFSLVGHVSCSAWAKYAIGYCYETGIVLENDTERARRWNYWAACEGCYHAQLRMKL